MKELIFPSCPLCRNLRIAMGLATIFVIAVYVVLLIGMNNKPAPPA